MLKLRLKFEMWLKFFKFGLRLYNKVANSKRSNVRKCSSPQHRQIKSAHDVTDRVFTKWLNFLRKVCAIFAQIFFANFCALNAMSFALFFCAICAKPEIFFAKVAHETKFQFCLIFLRNLRKTASFTQNVSFQENCQKLIF